jgi:outer membrane protein OmpA-like peptidoglycan-associated protein
MRKMTLAIACLVVLTSPIAAKADEDVVNFSGQDPTEDDIVDALIPKVGRTRGVSPGAVTSAGAAASPSTMSKPAKASFDQITFELNSDRILPRARPILDKLGQALQSEDLMDLTFLIEGHTDVSGSMDYNMRLSKRRAESVKRYLVENYGIDASRLKTIGKGPTDLLDKNEPRSGVNRRVVFATAESE